MTERDRALGMDRKITRRDLLNGVAVGMGGAMAESGLWLGGTELLDGSAR